MLKFYYNREGLRASPLERGGWLCHDGLCIRGMTHLPHDCKRQGYSSQEEIKHFAKSRNFTTTARD